MDHQTSIRYVAFHVITILCLCGSLFISSCSDPSNSRADSEIPGPSVENNIRSYLNKVSADITDDFHSDIQTLSDWEKIRHQRYVEFIEMMGIDHLPLNGEKSALNVKVTGTTQQEGYRIEKLYFESLPGLYVRANLYIPDSIKAPRPAILYVCGHSPTQKAHYQAHPIKFAQLGFVCLITETIQFGEVQGHHWGPYSKGWFNWYSRGYNPAGVELWNAIRAIDLLSERPEVDADKIGVTGISGGGSQSWYIAAADPRIKAVAPVCGGATLKDHVFNRTVDGHCDCMMPNNLYGRDFADIGALIAPRPLLIAQANQDEMYKIESVRELESKAQKMYDLYGKPDNISLVETPGGHSYHQTSRQEIFSFFIDKLMGKKITPDQVGDIDENPENQLSFEELKVYVDGPPEGDRTRTIQDSFIPIARALEITTEEELSSHRDSVKVFLREKTFGHFPVKEAAFDSQLEIQSMFNENAGNRIFSFVSEEGWRLKIDVRWRGDSNTVKPLMIVLRNNDEDRWDSESFASKLSKDWNIAYFEPRGVGETGWDPGLQWHIRRASAWTGRTIASMQVYDVLRSLQFCRTLPGIDPTKIGIAARDEMAVVALYAALLDGKCEAVILNNPPATQDVTSDPEGKGPAIEMLNCLQATDVNQIPALIWPAKTTFVGDVPEAYQWSENILKRLGRGGFARNDSN
ncbi:MAG: acetylxylan esterase [Imperialibacter sp.]